MTPPRTYNLPARAAALAWCALIFALSSRADMQAPGWLDAIPFSDKIAHFLLYAALGALWAAALSRERAGFLRRNALWLALAWAALFGASDEWHQSFVPGRQPDAADWAADLAGAAAACLAIWFHRVKSRARTLKT